MTLEETIGAVVAALLLLLKTVHYYRARASGHSRWESLRPWPLDTDAERWQRLNERLARIEERLDERPTLRPRKRPE